MTRLVALVAVLCCTACTPEQVIRWAFREHPTEVQDQAVEIAWCESRFDEDARSRGGHVGWFQFSHHHIARAERLGFSWDRISTEGTPNAILAEDLYSEQGFEPWSCAR